MSKAAPPAVKASHAPSPSWWETRSRWMWVAVFVATLLAYWPALNGGFLWDDSGHVTRPELRSLGGLWQIWFHLGATQQYYPLLHSAFWLESHLWGDATAGYHLVNVLLHATGACLVAVTLRRLAIPGAWLAAWLFALHPVCVESVAWISEQKNTLSLVLYLCAMLAYLRFDEERRPTHYVVATLLFVAALATKTVTATLPAALLVIFWWRRGRIDPRREALPLAPWFALALGAGLLTAWVERTLIGAQGSSFSLDVVQRVLLAGRVIWFYLAKVLWPANLMFVYPRWQIDASQVWQLLFPLAAVAAAAALYLTRRRGLLAGFLFFVGSLFPALGFVNVYPFVFSFVADHFQYLPSLGVIVPAAVGLTVAIRRWGSRAQVFALALIVGLGALTWRQSATYRNAITLFETTLEKNPSSWMAHNNLAEALAHAGRPADAVPHLEAALKIKPDLPEAENNWGDDLRLLGHANEAIPHLEHALALQPKFAEAHNNLGAALMEAGRPAEGIAHFEASIRLRPDYALAHFNLGLALASNGRPADAIAHFAEAVRIEPTYAEAEVDWGVALTLTNRFAEAVPHFERALQLEPGNARAHNNYGRALATANRYDEAITHYKKALELDSTNPEPHYNLALALHQLGRNSEAQQEYEEARRLGGGGQ